MSIFEKLTRPQLIGLAIALGVILFLALNVIFGQGFRSSRADLTENNLFSLSQGTKTLLGDLKEPIHMRLFLSKGLVQQAPQLAAYANRVQSVLNAYKDLSSGKITLEVIDPEPFSEAEDRAVGLGINRFRVSGASQELFFGLAATNSTNGRKEIPVFSPDRETFLEYDLTRLVAELGQPKKPVISIIDGLGISGDYQRRVTQQQILAQLKELFKVELLTGDVDKLPENTRVVLVVHPIALSDRTLFTLDQWVMNGGATMIFVDPYAETKPSQQPGQPALNASSNLGSLFKAWGIGFDGSKVVGDPVNALRTVRQLGGREVELANYPWFSVPRAGMDTSDGVLAQLSSIVMTTAGAFTTLNKDVTLKPLLTASGEAGLLPTGAAASPYGDPRQLLTQIEHSDKPLVLAARVGGKLKSAYEKGKPKDSKWEGEPLKDVRGSPNVIVVGDADMLMDRNWIQRRQIFGQPVAEAFANNGPFVLNAIEQMAGGAVLADLRGRGVSWRPFDRIAALEKVAEARFLAKEQELLKRLQATEQKLQEIRSKAKKKGDVVSDDSAQAVQQFRSEMLSTRAELREVQFDLRRDVERLKTWITTFNVGLFPAFVAAIALLFALRRPKKPLPERSRAEAANRDKKKG